MVSSQKLIDLELAPSDLGLAFLEKTYLELVLSDLGLAFLNRVKSKASFLRPPLHKINRPMLPYNYD